LHTLGGLAAKYGARGVQFLGVNANPDEDLAAVARHAKEYAVPFPVLKDEGQILADAVGARVTPEAFVLDGERAVRYRGRTDDGYAARTASRGPARSPDLERALDAVLAGKPVRTAAPRAVGCSIPRTQPLAASARVTYFRDVLPILQERCQACHRTG